MKRIFFIMIAMAATACSGGGGGGGPLPGGSRPTPTPAPVVTPTPITTPTPVHTPTPTPTPAPLKISLIWHGQLAGAETHTTNNHRRSIMDVSTPEPILVSIPNNADAGYGYYNGRAIFDTENNPATATVVISPAPDPLPSASWSDPNTSNVVLGTPPNPSPSPDSEGVYPGSQIGMSTLTATVADSTVSITVGTLSGFQLSCVQYESNTFPPFGLIFNADGSISDTTDITQADLYFTGPVDSTNGIGCGASSYSTPDGSSFVLNAPGGIVNLGANQDFPSIVSSDYTSGTTQLVAPQDSVNDPNFTTFWYGFYIIQTHLGQYVKFQLNGPQGTSYGSTSGYYETSDNLGNFMI